MDQITFRYDSVLSDVHMLLPNARHLMTRLNRVGQPGECTVSWLHVCMCGSIFLLTLEVLSNVHLDHVTWKRNNNISLWRT